MIRVAAVGDLMVGDSSTAVGFGFRSRLPGVKLSAALAGLAPRLQSADIVIGNLECPLVPVGSGPSRWAQDQMRGDPEYARVFRQAGFTAIAVANNHAVQHGASGFAATVGYLRAEGIGVIGVRGEPPWQVDPVSYTHRSGSKVAMLGYSWRPRQFGTGVPPYAEVDPPAVLADIARARATHDSVIVSLHWGEEFVSQPSQEEVGFAHALVDRGADLVLGHHPHVTRPVERRQGSVIAYSLGNALADMLWMEQLRRGLLLEVELCPRPAGVRLTELRIDDSYGSQVLTEVNEIVDSPIAGLDANSYRAAIDAGLSAQRAALYKYTLRNLTRFPVDIVLSLIHSTARNKLESLTSRLGDKSR
jgi:gamma-polyglutamate biosynthesis protein CapA